MAGEYRCLSADDLARAIAEDRAHLQSEAPLSDETSPRRRAGPCGLYLMLPPLRRNNCDTTAPFSQWTKIKTFTDEKECRMHTIGGMQEYGYNTLRESAAQSGANVHFLWARAATRS